MNADERWLPVVGYEGRYEVSDLGNVRSFLRCRGLPVPRLMSRLIARGLLLPSSGEEASAPSSPDPTSPGAEVTGGTKQRQVEQ